jgi:hypothetical protein
VPVQELARELAQVSGPELAQALVQEQVSVPARARALALA